jgi:phosphatidylserine/phosphatidylglycerophosphate/cardiolipin synthase-like enzyme
MTPTDETQLHLFWAAPLAADIAAARESVTITALSFQPPRRKHSGALAVLWNAIAAAIANGATVTVVLPAPNRTHPAAAFNAIAATALHALGARSRLINSTRLLHAKTAVIDKRILWIGSGNWTTAATTHNHEAYLRVISPKLADHLLNNWRKTDLLHG